MLYILGGDIRTKTLPTDTPNLLKDYIYSIIVENPMKRPSDCKMLNRELREIREKVFGRTHTM